MASATAFDSLAIIAAALSALTEKQIVTKTEYDRISKEVGSGTNKLYVCAGKVNVVEEIKQTYEKTAQLVAQRHNAVTARYTPALPIGASDFENPEINKSNEIWESDSIDETSEILDPTETKRTRKWFRGLGCLGNCSICIQRISKINSPRLTQSYNRYRQEQNQNDSGEIHAKNQYESKVQIKVQRAANTIDLFVLLPLGGTITLEMESTHSLVTNIKYKIKERIGLVVTEQVLHFGGRLLEDGKSLNEYNIKANSTIHLSVKGRGGSKKDLFYLDSTYLDPSWDYDFTNISDGSTQFKRGGHPYYRPCGWRRIAIKVSGKYQNDKWLGQTGDSSNGEWAVTYHGTESNVFNNIANEGYIVGPRDAYGSGVYSSPKIDIAATRYATQFNYNGVNYKGVFQNRVNPKGVNIMNSGDYWVCPNKDNIRPYGLCVRKS